MTIIAQNANIQKTSDEHFPQNHTIVDLHGEYNVLRNYLELVIFYLEVSIKESLKEPTYFI